MDNDSIVTDIWKALADIRNQGAHFAVSAELHPGSADEKAIRLLSHIAELQALLENWVKSQNTTSKKASN